ncbi:Putative binding protein [bacterium HR17]|uniref:Binding protein n=1 Tax=Candidatus Fervidibacter japonicus TaxID=2035412 RepID=A0A2H5XAL1_9BACT|nr:Putative binding protein [bacterium HR17]
MLRLYGVAVIAALAVAGAVVWTQGQKAPPKPPAPAKKTAVAVRDEGWRITYGSPKAKVKVEAFYPIRVAGGESHEWVKDFARKLAEAFPEKVQVVVYDFASEKGGAEWQKRGLTCGAFLINGKTQIVHKGKTFVFMRNPATSGWTFEQLKMAVSAEVARVYGKGAIKPQPQKRPPAKKTSTRTVAPQRAAANGQVEIFVPCGLAGPYGDLARLFRQRHPEIALRPTVTGVVALLNLLRDGATPDIYLALGTYELTKLAEQDKFVEGSLVKCARIPLALIVPKHNPANIHRLEDLTSPKVHRIVTYAFNLSGGRGAQQALQAAKLWDAVKGKVFTPKVPDQAKQLLKKGQADAGILYRTCLRESYVPDQPPVVERDLVAVQTLPQRLYEPIYVGAVLVKGGKNLAAAEKFLRFLQTPEAQRVWRKWGFEPVEESTPPTKLSNRKPLFIYAGAAFRPPLEDMGRAFERRYGVPVRFNFTGSNCLLAQIILTRQGDLYLPGEEFYVRQAEKRGYVLKSAVIGYFVPVILVRKGNPKGVRSLRDLAKPGVKVGLGDPKACAVGEVSEAILRKNGLTAAVHKNVVLRAATVPELPNALRLGGIDACIVWDAVANYPWVRPAVEIVPIPPEQNVVTTCPMAVLKMTKNRQAAEMFLQFALTEGQRILRAHKFTARNDLPPAYAKALFSVSAQ